MSLFAAKQELLTCTYYMPDLFQALPEEFGITQENVQPMTELAWMACASLHTLLAKIEVLTVECDTEIHYPGRSVYYPEITHEDRMDGTLRGIFSFFTLITSQSETGSPYLRSSNDKFFVRRCAEDQRLYPTLILNHRPLLPKNRNHEDFGLTRDQLTQLYQNGATSQPGTRKADESSKLAAEVSRDWEESQRNGYLEVQWGKNGGNKFAPADTHLGFNLRYGSETGIEAQPLLVTRLPQAGRKQTFVAVAAWNRLSSFTGRASKLNAHLSPATLLR